MNWVTWVNTIVGIIGIVVGVIGVLGLKEAYNIKNSIKAEPGASVQQAQIIHNGLDSCEVVRLSEDVSRRKIEEVTKNLQKEIDEKQPRIKYGTALPEIGNEGDVFFLLKSENEHPKCENEETVLD